MAILHHVRGVTEQAGIKQLREHPESEMIPLMRRGGEQKQITAVFAKRFGEFEILGFAGFVAAAGGGEMVGFIKDN